MPPQFEVHTDLEQADSLANKLPQGKAWIDKYTPDTVMRNLLIGYGLELSRMEGNLNYTDDELSLIRTQDLINEWETEYGIPKSCFAGQDPADLEQRIRNILTIIAANGTSTEEQFENIAALLGLDVDVEPGTALLTKFTMTFPFEFSSDVIDARYTILVNIFNAIPDATFTHIFSFVFGDARVGLLKCFFEILKPANTRIVYRITENPDAPKNIIEPEITGNPTVGETLTVGVGDWTGLEPIVYTYQWRSDGVEIPGATNSTYDIVIEDSNKSIECYVTGTNSEGYAIAISNSIDIPAILGFINGNAFSFINDNGLSFLE